MFDGKTVAVVVPCYKEASQIGKVLDTMPDFVDRVIVVTFFIGSVLAGAAGVMNGLIFQNVDPYIGFQVGLVAFTAAVVGGIGSIPGAMIGGLAIGIGRAFSIGYVSSSYQDVIVFAILIGFLLLRPSGLFGTPAPQKV